MPGRRDELLNGKTVLNIKETKVVIENRQKKYYAVRRHSSPGYQPPAPETVQPLTFEPLWVT